MKKRRQKPAKTISTPIKIVGLWVIGLVTAFIVLGSVSRPILWVFVGGAALSYYLLTKKR